MCVYINYNNYVCRGDVKQFCVDQVSVIVANSIFNPRLILLLEHLCAPLIPLLQPRLTLTELMTH